jgi:hypothetical protein
MILEAVLPVPDVFFHFLRVEANFLYSAQHLFDGYSQLSAQSFNFKFLGTINSKTVSTGDIMVHVVHRQVIYPISPSKNVPIDEVSEKEIFLLSCRATGSFLHAVIQNVEESNPGLEGTTKKSGQVKSIKNSYLIDTKTFLYEKDAILPGTTYSGTVVPYGAEAGL